MSNGLARHDPRHLGRVQHSWPVMTFAPPVPSQITHVKSRYDFITVPVRSPLNSDKPVTNKIFTQAKNNTCQVFVARPLQNRDVSVHSLLPIGRVLQSNPALRASVLERQNDTLGKKDKIAVNLPLVLRNFPLRPLRWIPVTVPYELSDSVTVSSRYCNGYNGLTAVMTFPTP